MAKNKPKNKSGKAGSSKSGKQSHKPSASKAAAKAAPAKKANNDVEETFPPEAPVTASNDAPIAEPTETTREVETPTPGDAPEAANRFAGEQAPESNQPAPTSDIPERLKHVGPRTSHNDEEKLEKFVLANKITRTISEAQLSKSGINMTKINLLTGRIGKFKLKRSFRQEKFMITVVE